ncbi:Elicitin [Phytophthora infestans]|nr:Elicitin [Phytophthora infestans]KAI9986597.1 hypothetical protein PInf_025550 [Phytophthora infestans]
MLFGIFFFFLLSAFVAAAEDACPSTEVVKFAKLYGNEHLRPCQKVSAGFSIAPPKGYPTDPQVKAMCASYECRALIEDVLALKPSDCYLSFAGVKLNAYKIMCAFKDACNGEKDKDHEDDKHHSTAKPTTHYPTSKPADEKYYLTPKPTEDKHYSTSKPTDGKYDPTRKPTDEKYSKTPKPTDDKHYPAPKPTGDKDHHGLDEPMIVKTDHDDKHYPIHCADNEKANEADGLKPPMNGTALELFPMPNTTYKATPSPKP